MVPTTVDLSENSREYRLLKCVSTKVRAWMRRAKEPAIAAVECCALYAFSRMSILKVASCESRSAPKAASGRDKKLSGKVP